jgi:hypothetical protein
VQNVAIDVEKRIALKRMRNIQILLHLAEISLFFTMHIFTISLLTIHISLRYHNDMRAAWPAHEHVRMSGRHTINSDKAQAGSRFQAGCRQTSPCRPAHEPVPDATRARAGRHSSPFPPLPADEPGQQKSQSLPPHEPLPAATRARAGRHLGPWQSVLTLPAGR